MPITLFMWCIHAFMYLHIEVRPKKINIIYLKDIMTIKLQNYTNPLNFFMFKYVFTEAVLPVTSMN